MLTSSALIQLAKQSAALTSGQAGFTDDQLMGLATDVMRLEIVPEVLGQYEGHFIFEHKTPLITNKSTYRLPNRAIGGLMQAIYLKDEFGVIHDLKKVDIAEYTKTQTSTGNRPTSYMIVSNSVVLYPTPLEPSDELCFLYYFNPNALIQESKTRTIVAVSGNTITLPSIPTSFDFTKKFDVVNNESGNEIVAVDLTHVSHSGSVITFSENVEDLGVNVGMYFCQAGTSPVPMVPEILHPLLAECLSERISEIRQEQDRLKQSRERIKRLKDGMNMVLKSRVLNKPVIVAGKLPWL